MTSRILSEEQFRDMFTRPAELFQDYHISRLAPEKKLLIQAMLPAVIQIINLHNQPNQAIVYGPTPITSGYPVVELVEQGILSNEADIYHHPELLAGVVARNMELAKEDGLKFASSPARTVVEQQHGSYFYMNPTGIEHLGWLMKAAAAAAGLPEMKMNEADYMTLWEMLIRHYADVMTQKDFTSPWYASTGGVQEIMIATCVEAGLQTGRHGAEMTMLDRDSGAYVPLEERLQKVADRLKKQEAMGALHGASAGKVVTAFARLASIADWLAADAPCVANAHPALHGSDLTKAQAIIEEMQPRILAFMQDAKEAKHVVTEGLSQRYQLALFAGQEHQRASLCETGQRIAA